LVRQIDRILCVDDEPDIRRVLAAALAHGLGAEVDGVGSAAEAFDYLAAAPAPPDLIILDARMPEMNGFEACAKLRQDPALAGVPILFLTAGSDTEEAALAAGANGCLAKPFDPMTVGDQIRRLLER
jgi:CheY-like chemotaxis protein